MNQNNDGRDAALQAMGCLHHLAMDAVGAEGRAPCIFRILNSTIQLVPYDRAGLWELGRGGAVLLGVSGQDTVSPHTELARAWQVILKALPPTESAVTVQKEALLGSNAVLEEAWNVAVVRRGVTHVLWVPLLCGSEYTGGLLLERTTPWDEEEIALLEVLAEAYATALAVHRSRWQRWRRRLVASPRGKLAVCLVVLLLGYGLFFHPVPMRVVAPCEVIAQETRRVSATSEGMITAVVVQAGQEVKKGEVLLRLGTRELRAPCAGLVQRDSQLEPGRWVLPGAPLLRIISPGPTRLRLWVHQQDRLPDIETNPVYAYLDADPTRSYSGTLRFLSPAVAVSPQGVPSFVGEVQWSENASDLQPGVAGTAVLRGQPASLARWLLRKPLLALRRWFAL